MNEIANPLSTNKVERTLETVGSILNQTHRAIVALLKNVALPVGKTAVSIIGSAVNLSLYSIVTLCREAASGVLGALFRKQK